MTTYDATVLHRRTMNTSTTSYYGRKAIFVTLMILTSAGVDTNSRARESLHGRIECVTLDKRKPRQFISYEGVDNKAWDGRRHVKGAVLRLTNNSDCAILL